MGIFGVKTQRIFGQTSQNSARYTEAFWGKNHFFGRKVNKVPYIIFAIWEKNNFLRIFGVKTNGLLGKTVKIVLDMQAHFEEKITFLGEKPIKCPVL